MQSDKVGTIRAMIFMAIIATIIMASDGPGAYTELVVAQLTGEK